MGGVRRAIMRRYNMTKVFIAAVCWLMFSGFTGWLAWNFLGVLLFFGGAFLGYRYKWWFLK